ncbi:MAG: signal peptide peptidase SppA [Bacteroidetes bacterium]|nr:MAG: signal peptide peptidase SppA [Bacteroidota bacterium]
MSFLKTMLASMLGSFITIVVLSFIGFAIIMGVILAATADEEVTIPKKSVLYLDLNKPIADRSSKIPFYISPMNAAGDMGLDEILENIAKARSDDNISGIYLNTENIMTGLATLQEIRDALVDFRSSGKFLVSYGNYYSQGAYYLASAAGQLYLNPEGGLLLKGLNAQLMFLKGTLEKLDVDVRIIRHGKFKAATEPLFLDKMSAENREQITDLITDMWKQVIGDISQSRSIKPSELNHIADELLVQTAGDALKYGLVDTLLYKDELFARFRQLLELDSTAKIGFVSFDSYSKVADKNRSTAKEKIAVVYASGDVVDGEGSQDNIGGERISRTIRKAREDKRVKAIVLRVNSGGGSALASEVIWREIELATKEKPVVASFGNVAASGGYYIACAADKIMAEPSTITGSIGVWAAIPNLKGLMNNKLGITFDNAATNRNADFISVMKPLTPYQQAVIQKDVDHIYDVFSERVANGRNMSVTKVDNIGQGRIWSGTEALNLGLVDTLGGLDAAIHFAASLAGVTDYRISSLPVIKNPIDQLIEQILGKSTPDVYLKKALGEDYTYYLTLRKIRELKGVQARMEYEITVN